MTPATTGRSNGNQRRSLMELLTPIVAASGYYLDDVTITAAGKRSLIRVIVDGDTGVDLDVVAQLSRQISEIFDADSASAVFPGPYVLEVSSPGVDRELSLVRHWRRAIGRLVQVSVAGQPFIGRVLDVDESAVGFDCEGTNRRVSFADLGVGRMQVEFNRSEESNLLVPDPVSSEAEMKKEN